VASIPIPGGCSLRPVKKRGRGSFDKAVDQNFPPIFYSPPIFHWANYTLNKTLSLVGKEAQNGRENFSQKLRRNSAQNWGEVAPDFDSRFEEVEATEWCYYYCTIHMTNTMTMTIISTTRAITITINTYY